MTVLGVIRAAFAALVWRPDGREVAPRGRIHDDGFIVGDNAGNVRSAFTPGHIWTIAAAFERLRNPLTMRPIWAFRVCETVFRAGFGGLVLGGGDRCG